MIPRQPTPKPFVRRHHTLASTARVPGESAPWVAGRRLTASAVAFGRTERHG